VITKRSQIEVNGTSVEVVRKDIKNLHLAVYPPHGRVRVSAPLRLEDEAVRLAVISRLSWIRRRQRNFRRQERQSAREYVTGESHYFQGRRYRLRVIENESPGVRLKGKSTLELLVPKGSNAQRREAIMSTWYRRELRAVLPSLITKWINSVEVAPTEVQIKKMRTRWGSCNAAARRVWLNLELIKKPPQCLEYVLVHELVHFGEKRHNERFQSLMDKAMPQWRVHRDELNALPLAHENWKY
jgi:predicted metal-dependent hydrolase